MEDPAALSLEAASWKPELTVTLFLSRLSIGEHGMTLDACITSYKYQFTNLPVKKEKEILYFCIWSTTMLLIFVSH